MLISFTSYLTKLNSYECDVRRGSNVERETGAILSSIHYQENKCLNKQKQKSHHAQSNRLFNPYVSLV